MTNLNTVLIGDFLKRIRRPVDIDKNKEYKLLTVKLHHKGVLLRCIKNGSEIGAKKMYAVKAGDFILSGIDARNGAVGIVPQEMSGAVVTNDFWYFNVDANVIDKSLFLELTQTSWFDEICRKGSDGTTQRIRLQKDKFYNQEIQLPPKENHATLLKKILNTKTYGNNLLTEITYQQSLLKKLRQSILQDAISGKLTNKWREENPDVEPASKLLARIKAEKERLVKEKKIKKQKPLTPITEAEIPFELPDGWVWCRLGELPIVVEYGTSSKTSDSGNVAVFAMGHIQNGKLNHGNFKYLSDSNKDLPKLYLKHNDLLFNRTNSWELVGKTAIYKGEDNKFSFASYLIRLQFIYCNAVFYNYVLNSQYYRESQIEPQIIKQCGQANFNGTKLQSTVVPSPPEKEFKIIVSKVEKLFAYCEQIEQQIVNSQQDSELLMQAVLKEAFEG